MTNEDGRPGDGKGGAVWKAVFGGGAAVVALLAVGIHTGWAGGSLSSQADAFHASLEGASPEVAQPAVATEMIEVPLHAHEGRLWIPVEGADGSEFRFILGTGSPGTLYSESGAARQAQVGDLFMGGRADAPVNMADAQTLPDSLFFWRGEQFDGQLAPNTLNAYDMLLDGPGRKLLLQPIGRPPTWDGYALSDPVRLRVYHGTVLTVPVDFGGTTVTAMLALSAPSVIGNPAVGAAGLIAEDGTMDMSIGGTSWDLPGSVEDDATLRRFSAPEDPFAMVGGVIAVDCPIAISYVRAELRTCVR